MGSVIALVVMLGFGVGLAALIWWGTKGRSNRWPALGTNLAQYSGDGMVWWKRRALGSTANPSIPSVEEALGPHYDILTVDEELRHRNHAEKHAEHHVSSWMDDPDAFLRDGLVDAPSPKRDGGD